MTEDLTGKTQRGKIMNRSRKWKNPSINKNSRRRAIKSLRRIIANEPADLPKGMVADSNPDAELMLILLETEDNFDEQQRRLRALAEEYAYRPTWGERIFEILFPLTVSNRYIHH
jgi:hypothetical protein